ncbi:MAG: hypothetical protein RLZZ303_1434 [Candidatus Hydrogenedentota bacterium]|jgi:SAM-dependent methyltransferase
MSGLRQTFNAAYFEANYRDYARQNPARKLEFYRALLDKAAPAGGKLLEMGCAFGSFLSGCGQRWQPHGFDPSLAALLQARKARPGARLWVGSAEHLPCAEYFDAVTAFDVIEHVPDLEAVRREVVRVLAPGGVFLFVVPVYDGPTGPVIHLLDRDPTHVHKQGRDFWLSWAGEAFVLERWLGVYRYLLPGGYYAHVPTERMRRATPAIAVVARKKPA